jgi:pimeloyl-ACP methyl ester carboxylesterase
LRTSSGSFAIFAAIRRASSCVLIRRFAQDAIDNQKLVSKGKLTLAIGGDHSYGAHLATEIGFAASNVRSAVINNSGHWIMEEQGQQAIAVIIPFLKLRRRITAPKGSGAR